MSLCQAFPQLLRTDTPCTQLVSAHVRLGRVQSLAFQNEAVANLVRCSSGLISGPLPPQNLMY